MKPRWYLLASVTTTVATVVEADDHEEAMELARYREIEGVEGDGLITEVWVVPDGQLERLSLEVVAVALTDTPDGEGPPQQDRHSGESE